MVHHASLSYIILCLLGVKLIVEHNVLYLMFNQITEFKECIQPKRRSDLSKLDQRDISLIFIPKTFMDIGLLVEH